MFIDIMVCSFDVVNYVLSRDRLCVQGQGFVCLKERLSRVKNQSNHMDHIW